MGQGLTPRPWHLQPAISQEVCHPTLGTSPLPPRLPQPLPGPQELGTAKGDPPSPARMTGRSPRPPAKPGLDIQILCYVVSGPAGDKAAWVSFTQVVDALFGFRSPEPLVLALWLGPWRL